MTMKGNPVDTEFGSGLQVGDFFFLSAVDACGEAGEPVGVDSRERILFCMKKIQDVLLSAGGNLESLVQLRFYCSDSSPLTAQDIREVLAELIEEPLPALSVIPSGRIPGELMADGIAVILNSTAGCGGCKGCGGVC